MKYHSSLKDDVARSLGATIPFLRDENLSKTFVDVETILADLLKELEAKARLPLEHLLILYPTNPFRPKGFIDRLINQYFDQFGKIDSIVSVMDQHEPCWKEENHDIVRIDEGLIPRVYKQPIFVGVQGLGLLTHKKNIKGKNILGDKTGLLLLDDPFCRLEVRNKKGVQLVQKFIDEWWETH